MSLRRLCSVSYTMILDSADLMFDNDQRKKIIDLFAWPDDHEAMTAAEQDSMARAAAGQLGLSNPDELFRRAAEARAAAGVQ